jgi:capsular exopolysaccharide synthesis family protein
MANVSPQPVNTTPLDVLIMCALPDSAIAESFRMVRTALTRALEQGNKKLLFVSPWGSDGKSMVTANLAVALAQVGKRVVLVDGDLRRPTLSYLFGDPALGGFSNVLGQGGSVLDVVQQTAVPQLHLLASGTFVAKPADLMSGPRCRSVLGELSDSFDCVLIDTAPMSFFAEGSLLASQVDGVVVILNPRRWRGEEEVEVKRRLEEANANIVGLVLNGDEEGRSGNADGYYYGSYKYYYSSKKPKPGWHFPKWKK